MKARKHLHYTNGWPAFQCVCGAMVTRKTDREMMEAAIKHMECCDSPCSPEVIADLKATLARK